MQPQAKHTYHRVPVTVARSQSLAVIVSSCFDISDKVRSDQASWSGAVGLDCSVLQLGEVLLRGGLD